MEDLAFTAAIILVLLGLPVAAVTVQVLLLRRWRGGFRMAALLPAGVWGIWVLSLAVSWAADPTDRNLFPFEAVLIALGVLAYLALLAVVRRFVIG